MLRHLAAFFIALAGLVGVIALSVGMNAVVNKVVTEPVSVIAELPPPAKTAPKSESRRKRSTPTRSARKAAPSPAPLLAANLSGLDFGFQDVGDAAMIDATRELVGALGGAVMDESAVEAAPTPTEQTPPSFPARARSLGQSGWVTLSFVVDVDGSTQDVSVVEASPPGVFDDAAITAVRSWAFSPGQQDGAPVAVRVRQTLRFELE